MIDWLVVLLTLLSFTCLVLAWHHQRQVNRNTATTSPVGMFLVFSKDGTEHSRKITGFDPVTGTMTVEKEDSA